VGRIKQGSPLGVAGGGRAAAAFVAPQRERRSMQDKAFNQSSWPALLFPKPLWAHTRRAQRSPDNHPHSMLSVLKAHTSPLLTGERQGNTTQSVTCVRERAMHHPPQSNQLPLHRSSRNQTISIYLSSPRQLHPLLLMVLLPAAVGAAAVPPCTLPCGLWGCASQRADTPDCRTTQPCSQCSAAA